MKSFYNIIPLQVLLILFFITAFLGAPSYAQELKLSSDPVGASVSVRDTTGAMLSVLGKTPLTRNIQELSGQSKSGFVVIAIEKDGYLPQSILVSSLLKSEMVIHVNLDPFQDHLNYKNIDKVISDLFEAQRLIRSQQYDEAISFLKTIEEKESNISVIPEMIAGGYYLKKDMKTALTWYRKAYRLNTENKDASTLKAYLEKALGNPNDENK